MGSDVVHIRVSFEEVTGFVSGDSCVSSWLRRYRSGPLGGSLSGSRLNKARMLCRFFKWLRVVKGLDFSPKMLLERQLKLRVSSSMDDRQWLLNLVLEHSRDNPVFARMSSKRKYDVYQTIKFFFDCHEAPLTSARNMYGNKKHIKKHRKQITLVDAKEVLGKMCQRDRAILLIILQSGMELGAVLYKFNYMWHQVKSQLGKRRMKIEFDERKANGKWYFTYISRDGIHELKKWLTKRERLVHLLLADGVELSKSVIEGEPIFLTKNGTPLNGEQFAHLINRKTKGKVTSHMFRKLFKSEASVPERAITRGIVEFWMGHCKGIDAVGGDYDRNPEIHEEVFEKEYAKLEPFINIYSGSGAVQRTEDPLMHDIEKLAQLPHGREFFEELVADAKTKLSEKLNQHIE